NPPAFAMRRARVDVIPEKFITAAIPRMNAIVMMGSASWRRVRPYVVKKRPSGAPRIAITMKATIDAKSTRLPAAARKSQVKVTGYGVDLVTIVGSWEIRALGLAEVPL